VSGITTHLDASEYFLADVDISTARELVERDHYAKGASNTRVYTHGLFRRDAPDVPLGAAWWLPPTKVAAQTVVADWRHVLSLSRLVVAAEVPTNGASFLLGRSMRLVRSAGIWRDLVTYADEGQGHTGAIYLATNWEYVGTRPGDPVYIDPESGRHVSRKSANKSRTNAEMLALGYINSGRSRKHKFVKHLAAATTQSLAA
jgi:hypothetical protein